MKQRNHARKWMAALCALLLTITAFPISGWAYDLPYAEGYEPCENHQFVWEMIQEPSCTNPGLESGYCTICGIDDDRYVDPLGHSWGAWEDGNNAATCTTGGSIYRYCTRCGQMQEDSSQPLGHDWGAWEDVQLATCEFVGKQFRSCRRCDANDFRQSPALGHDWSGWTTIQNATCTSGGTERSTCNRCGITSTRDTSALGHSWTGWITVRDATCSTSGLERSTCNRCGITDTRETGYAAHKWGEWKVTKQPTAFENGTEERTCSVCGKKEQRALAPDGILSVGSRGDKVKELQETLNQAGFDCGTADGIYGNMTAHAVSEYEKSVGLPEDGIAWPGVQELMFSYLLLENISEMDGVTGALGDDIPLQLQLKNMGTRAVIAQVHNIGDGNASLEEDKLDPESDTWMNPGDDMFYTFTIRVLQSDVDSGLIRRTVRASGIPAGTISLMFQKNYSPEFTEEEYQKYEDEEKEITEDGYPSHLVWSNYVDIEIPLKDSAVDNSGEMNGTQPPSGPSVPGEVTFTKYVSEFTPAREDGYYYPGDTIEYVFMVENGKDYDLTDAEISDPLKGSNEDAIVTLAETIPAGEIRVFAFQYPVSITDAVKGEITNTATLAWLPPGADALETLESTVTVKVRSEDGYAEGDIKTTDSEEEEELPLIDFEIRKEEISSPANGSYYKEGETIQYRITIQNNSSEDVGEVINYDIQEEGTGEFSYCEFLHTGESRTYELEHKVTAADAEAGFVLNQAYSLVDVDGSGTIQSFESNPVVSPTSGDFVAPENFEEAGSIKTPIALSGESEGDAPCTNKLVSYTGDTAEYERSYCKIHGEVSKSVSAMLKAADTDAAKQKAWEYAAELWTEEIEKMYEAELAAADPAASLNLMNERILFYAVMGTQERLIQLLYPDNPEIVAEKTAKLLENQSVNMCYELHTAPEARADRRDAAEAKTSEPKKLAACSQKLLDSAEYAVHYQEELCEDHAVTFAMSDSLLSNSETPEKAWEQIQKLWEMELKKEQKELLARVDEKNQTEVKLAYAAFRNWLAARAKILAALYPESPATVMEVSSQTVAGRVWELCSTKE